MKDDMASNNATLKTMALVLVAIAEVLSLALIYKNYRTNADIFGQVSLLGLPLMALVPWAAARRSWRLVANDEAGEIVSARGLTLSRQITLGLIGAYGLFIYAVGSLDLARM